MTGPALRIAVLVPCFNEEAAVATVVSDFRKALPTAQIFVYDNNSKDRTIEVARAAGAIVRSERRQGKGHVVRRMFADIDADIYVLVDGDATYDAPSAPRMIDALVNDHLDMVVGFRVDQSVTAYRPGHRTGNWMLTSFLSAVFGIFLVLVSIGLAIPVIVTYLEEGIVPRLPTAVLSMGLMIVAVLSVTSGLVLDTVTRGRREMK